MRLLRRVWWRIRPPRWTQAEVDAINERAQMLSVRMRELADDDSGESW
jgi:hypothetical protein